MGVLHKGYPTKDVREVVAENVRGKFSERINVSLRGNNGNESNKAGKEGFPSICFNFSPLTYLFTFCF